MRVPANDQGLYTAKASIRGGWDRKEGKTEDAWGCGTVFVGLSRRNRAFNLLIKSHCTLGPPIEQVPASSGTGDGAKTKRMMSLAAPEFLRRFLLYVLPPVASFASARSDSWSIDAEPNFSVFVSSCCSMIPNSARRPRSLPPPSRPSSAALNVPPP